MIETTAPWLVIYSILGYLIGWWVITTIMNKAFDRGYWVGRAEGWKSHRALSENKYDANNN
jgi:hypothetical protein